MEKVKEKPGFHYAFMILLCCCIFAATSVSIIYACSGVFYTPVSESLGVSRGVFTISVTLMNLVTGIAVTAMRLLAEKFDVKAILIALIILQGGCLALQSQFTKVWMFYITGICFGFVASFIPQLVPTLALNRWFKTRVGFYMGFSSSMTGLSGIIINPIAGRFMEAYGWEKTYLLYAGIMLFIALPFAILIFKNDPKDKGLEPYGDLNTEKEKKADKPEDDINDGVSYYKAVRSRAFIFTVIAMGGIGGSTTFVQYVPSYAQSVGMTLTVAATLAGILQIGSVFGKNIIGIIADKKPSLIIYMGSLVPCLGLLIMLTLGRVSLTYMKAGAIIFGVINSTTILNPIFTMKVFGMKDFMRIFSSVALIISLVLSCMSSLWGFIADFFGGNFTPCILIAMTMLIISCITGTLAYRDGQKLKEEARRLRFENLD